MRLMTGAIKPLFPFSRDTHKACASFFVVLKHSISVHELLPKLLGWSAGRLL